MYHDLFGLPCGRGHLPQGHRIISIEQETDNDFAQAEYNTLELLYRS